MGRKDPLKLKSIPIKFLFFTQSEKILHEAWHIRQDSVLYDIFSIIFLLIFSVNIDATLTLWNNP